MSFEMTISNYLYCCELASGVLSLLSLLLGAIQSLPVALVSREVFNNKAVHVQNASLCV